MSMARATTSQELNKFLSDGHASKVRAIIVNPPVVLACQVNQNFSTHDGVVQFLFDNVISGSYSNVREGMTVLLGSTPGAYDKGITFARKAPTSNTFYVGETSEVAWANDLFATVLRDFSLWPQYLTMDQNGAVYMKYDIAYTDQHLNKNPVPILGSDRVLRLTGSSVTVQLDASNSYAPGSSVQSHLFTCSGATVTGGTTATPSFEFTSCGSYLVEYTLTAANGKSTTTYREIHVWDDTHLITEISLKSLNGEYLRGGYDFSFTVADQSFTARPRAKVILFSEDWFGGVLGSIGPLSGAENIMAQGWIGDSSESNNEDGGDARITARGPYYWFQKMHNYISVGLQSVTSNPTSWIQMKDMTIDMILWHFLMWRTTSMLCMDVFLTGDTRQAKTLEAPAGNMWEQIITIADLSILSRPCCDPLGRLFIQTDTSLLLTSERTDIPTVVSLTHDDWESIEIEEIIVTPASQVIMSSLSIVGGVGSAFFSLSPGHTPYHYGSPLVKDGLLESSQANSNERAGNILEKENVPFRFSINGLMAANQLIGICPRQRIHIDIVSGDVPSGTTFSGYALVRSVNIEHDPETGIKTMSITADAETKARLYCNGDIPPVAPGEAPWVPPASPQYPPISFPSPYVPPAPTKPALTPLGVIAIYVTAGTNSGLWFTDKTKILTTVPWYQATDSSWTSDEKSKIVGFKMNKYGRCYLYCNYNVAGSTETNIYSVVLGGSGRTIVANNDYFLATMGTGPYGGRPNITAFGVDLTRDKSMAVYLSMQYPDNRSAGYITNGADSLTKTITNNGVYELSGDLAFYDNEWYLTMGYGLGQIRALYRYNAGFSSINYWANNNIVYLNHAEAGDYILTYPPNNQTGIGYLLTNKGNTQLSSFGQGHSNVGAQFAACDPTGQFIMTYNGSVAKSSNFGATWTSLSFPYTGGQMSNNLKFVNLGDENRWMVFFNLTPSAALGIQYTEDGGVTWSSKLGNLIDQVPQTAGVLGAYYA